MRNLMIVCVMLVAGAVSALAQSSAVTVKNKTNCAYLVQLVNARDDCGATCTTTAICVLPGTSVTIAPCNSNWYWDRAIVTPTYDDCTPCTTTPVIVSSPEPTNCLNLSTTATANHCAGCAPFTVDFATNTQLHIY